MKKIFFALVLVVFVFGISGGVFAGDEKFVREEAARREIKLISVSEVKEIVSKKFGSKNITFREIDLDNEADDYPNSINFRPIYQIECFSNGSEYDVDIDAVTGEILKFKLDD